MLGFGLMELSQSYKNELSGIFLQSRGLFLRIASKIQHAGTGTLSGHVAVCSSITLRLCTVPQVFKRVRKSRHLTLTKL